MLLDHPHDNVSPTDMQMYLVPFWVQIHDLPVRAMNKQIGEKVGALLGSVLEVYCDGNGKAIGKCTRIRVLLNIHNPIIRWTNINIGGVARKVLFRYEKLVDFYYLCGRLDHLQKSCSFAYPDGLKHYGP